MTREEKEQIGKYVLQMARLLEDGCYQQEMLLKAVHIIDEALEPCEDWYDVPSDEMTLEQARQAVKDLRKKLMEYLEQEPTTKNDLGVDYISRKAVLEMAKSYNTDGWDMYTPLVVDAEDIEELPSVTPQLSVPEVTALAEWTEKLTKASEDAYNKGYADGVKSVNICPHCGEYIGEEE